MKNKENENKQVEAVTIPCGSFCSGNCADGCIYWNPYDRDSYGRQWCNYYDTYYYPSDRNGCFAKKE